MRCLSLVMAGHEGEVCKPWLAKEARLGSLECGFIKARPRGVASSWWPVMASDLAKLELAKRAS
ncbi:hypothetical protein TIFTF001_033954 [Ficus carica]|uniref:Uncharacterized protein n=1 Tax=Ficus carica TaxID=3494 RepID=A0AA88CXI1_FICCA|nr:hypothetical protein TIFTF001_040039 [Ficus carica]GMN33869.1 hypothetical protein TIFTF001_041965 [Ficus carica]GMN58690.1 hypothetical protein TIFTF001_027802 [Ficus carica]GMN61671.1 hypothetical protein TIFTF001_030754 [Ficus carica]GMN62981.1 hypothetical protein TIFTF001_032079 [Ficus carica]